MDIHGVDDYVHYIHVYLSIYNLYSRIYIDSDSA